MLFHYQPFNAKSGVIFITIFLVSFIVEAIGVASGLLFGNYSYGSGLGYKLLETPIIIGLNWVFVSYISASLGCLITRNRFQSILISSLIMVVYDVVLEQVAPKLDMWSWQDGVVPIQNYLAWFFMALIFQILLKISKIDFNNRMSLLLLVCQILFFIILIIKL